MRHLGQLAQVAEPAHLVGRIALEQAFDHLAGADRGDRCVQALGLAVVFADGLFVQIQRLAEGTQLGMRMGHGDARFEYRRVARVAAGQLAPRHQCQGMLLVRGGGPAEAEQGLVGVQTIDAHAFEQAPGVLDALLLQGGHAEREVGAVAQAALLFVLGRGAADLVEQGRAAGHVAALEQGHAQVEAGEGTGFLGRRAHGLQHAGGTGEVARAPSATGPAAVRGPRPGRAAVCPRCVRVRLRPVR